MSNQIVAVAAGNSHSLALLESGLVYSWGDNEYGQLGINTFENREKSSGFKLIETIPGRVVALAAGAFHSLALLESGEVYGWGRNTEGQLGDGTTRSKNRPQLIKAIPDKIIGISAGRLHSLAIPKNGKVYVWGDNEFGQLGDGTTKMRMFPKLIKKIPGKVIDIAAGDYHSLALLEGGKIYSWGRNYFGQLGDGTTKERTRPQLIKTIPGKVIRISAGTFHSLALLESGEVYVWGSNIYRQLGVNNIKAKALPQLIEGIPGKVVNISSGDNYSLVLLESGKIYGWGWNDAGQLGPGKLTTFLFPKIISKGDKRLLFSSFGNSGRAVSFNELERLLRTLLGQEFHL